MNPVSSQDLPALPAPRSEWRTLWCSWPGATLFVVLAVVAGLSRSITEFLAVALVFSPAAFALLCGSIHWAQRSLARHQASAERDSRPNHLELG